MTEGRLIIGKITAAHGIKGEVTVFPLTDDARRFLKLKNASLCDEKGDNEIPCVIKAARIDRDRVLVRIEGCDDRNKAETYKGRFLSVSREDAVKLNEGSYFIEDLKGINVVDDSKGDLGVVNDVIKSGAQHIVMIRRAGKQDLMVPFAKDIFYDIKPSEGSIRCRLPEGLYELYEV
ncbi:MAG: 16S rRNA processing protein RimM [Clostridiales bacterium]|nr:16S rRNA processing protein RimM [Clostridiales bacterium]